MAHHPCCNAASPAGGKIHNCAPPQPDHPQAPAYQQSAIPTIGQTSCLERKLELFLDRVVLLYGRVALPRAPTVGDSDYGTDLLSAPRFTVHPCRSLRNGLSICRPHATHPARNRPGRLDGAVRRLLFIGLAPAGRTSSDNWTDLLPRNGPTRARHHGKTDSDNRTDLLPAPSQSGPL